jgi:hypothetical protein
MEGVVIATRALTGSEAAVLVLIDRTGLLPLVAVGLTTVLRKGGEDLQVMEEMVVTMEN